MWQAAIKVMIFFIYLRSSSLWTSSRSARSILMINKRSHDEIGKDEPEQSETDKVEDHTETFLNWFRNFPCIRGAIHHTLVCQHGQHDE